MVKNHMKRIAMPRTWKLDRKVSEWVTKPSAGAHDYETAMSLETVMKEIIKCANTRKEARTILLTKDVLVDGKKRKELRLPVGFMDVVSLPEVNEHYRMLLNRKGEITAMPIKKEESGIKPCKITGKRMIEGGITQINLFDSRNLLFKKGEKIPYNVGDTLLISLPKQEIKNHFKLEKGAYVYLTGGKHIGKSGVVEEITRSIFKFKSDDGVLSETAKSYAFVIGKDKASISIM
ncbi:MAG TPA: 30S ribosomal protein S4e [Candidatus Nanoarchaeia archaeon]|nr:30S ribosomal protein S4e [Candidatus Nanoarchaeia archaeon]